METIVAFVTFVLSAMGLTVVVVWPETGPGAWCRERLLRPLLPKRIRDVFDCYICFGFWTGLGLGALWSVMLDIWFYWFGCLMIPAMFWIILQPWKDPDSTYSEDGNEHD